MHFSVGTKKEKWVKDNQGQMVITAGQIVWTAECEKALSEPEGAKKALRLLKKKWVSYLNKLTAITRSKLTKIERNKVSHFVFLMLLYGYWPDGSTACDDHVWSAVSCSRCKLCPAYACLLLEPHAVQGWRLLGLHLQRLVLAGGCPHHIGGTCTRCH